MVWSAEPAAWDVALNESPSEKEGKSWCVLGVWVGYSAPQ